MFTLHTGFFARLLAALAVVGLLLGGATTSVMAMSPAQGDSAAHNAMVSIMAGDNEVHQDGAMPHQSGACEQADHAYGSCSDTDNNTFHCDAGGDCCPHGATALPPQIDAAFVSLPDVQAAALQWRSTSVTSVTEIRPPIFTL